MSPATEQKNRLKIKKRLWSLSILIKLFLPEGTKRSKSAVAQGRTIEMQKTINGQSFTLEKIGKGAFSTAYRDLENPDQVLIFVRDLQDQDLQDYSKEALADWCYSDNQGAMKHIPKMEWLDQEYKERGNFYQVFLTDFYENLSAKHKQAWTQHKQIKRLFDQALTSRGNNEHALDQTRRFLKLAEKELDQDMYDALIAVSDAFRNFDDPSFDLGKRNFGVSNEGVLILRDVVFCQEKMRKIWKLKAQKRNARGF